MHGTKDIAGTTDEPVRSPGADYRAVGDVPRERPCLACGEKFQSDGWGNRLCPKCCKRSNPPNR
jgi:hypothetical protein